MHLKNCSACSRQPTRSPGQQGALPRHAQRPPAGTDQGHRAPRPTQPVSRKHGHQMPWLRRQCPGLRLHQAAEAGSAESRRAAPPRPQVEPARTQCKPSWCDRWQNPARSPPASGDRSSWPRAAGRARARTRRKVAADRLAWPVAEVPHCYLPRSAPWPSQPEQPPSQRRPARPQSPRGLRHGCAAAPAACRRACAPGTSCRPSWRCSPCSLACARQQHRPCAG